MAVRLQRCIDAMAAAAGRPLSDDEMIRVAERLQDRVDRLRRSRGSASDEDLLRDAARELRHEAEHEAALQRRTAMLQATANTRLRAIVDRYADPVLAFNAILGGVNTPGGPSRFSIDYRGKGLANEWTGALAAALRQAAPDDRLLTAFRRGDLDDDIAREMWAMRPGAAVAGVTSNADALAIARILHDVQEQGRLRANRAGAWIDPLEGYIVRQSHDALRLLRAGFEAWRDTIRPLLGDATFERAQARIDALEATQAAALADREAALEIGRGLQKQLSPYAARLRQVLEENRTAGAQRDALARPVRDAAQLPEGETFRDHAVAQANQAAGRERRKLADREADALGRLADRLERMGETQDEKQLAKLQQRLYRDWDRVRRRLDDSALEAAGLGQFADRVMRAVDDVADRRRRAEARVRAAEDGIRDLDNRGRVDDSDEFLRAVFDDIVSGRTLHPEMGGNHVAGVGGSANVALKMSRARVLHFKDADAWLTYHRAFGMPGQLATAAVGGLERLAKFTALIEQLGPNPRATFERAIAYSAERHHGNPEIVRALRSAELEHLFQHVSGEANAIQNPTRAAVGAFVRGFNVITKLGMMVISSVTDTTTLASEARFQGRGYLTGYRQGLEDVLSGTRRGEERHIADMTGAGLEGFRGAIGARLGAVDGAPGMMAWAVRKFYALNLGAWWTDAHKIGATFMQTRAWSMEKALEFDALSSESRRLFGLYGIGADEWNLLRATADVEANGRGYLLPSEVRRMPTHEVSRILGRPLTDYEAIRILDDAGDRFSTLLADRADYAVPTPGAREISWMYGGHQPGSWHGEALRLFWQFKQFPVSVLSKAVGRDLYGSESRFHAATGIAAFFVQSMAMGYVAMTLKDVLKNKEPRDPLAWQTMLAAAAQGGGAGLYGDFLFGEFNRFGRSWAESVAGPTFGGLVPDLAELTAKAIRVNQKGEWELKAKDAVRFGAANMPFVGLFYTKPVLDQIILAEIYEHLNPGYRRRAERDLERSEGRGFLFHP